MARFFAIFFCLYVPVLLASQVTKVANGGKNIIVSADGQRWIVGESVCVYQGGLAVACGMVTKANSKGAIVRISHGSGVNEGDRVIPASSRDLSTLVSSSETVSGSQPKKVYVGAGFSLSPSYFFPSLNVQFQVAKNFSIGLVPSYIKTSGTDFSLSAISALATGNFYHLNRFEGLWAQLGLGLFHYSIQSNSQSESANSITVLGTGGYRFAFGNVFSVGGGLGVQYISALNSSLVVLDFSSVQPVFLIDLGVRF